MEFAMHQSDNLMTFIRMVAPVNGRRPTLSMMRNRVKAILAMLMEHDQLEQVVRSMVEMTGLSHFLPEQYVRFQPVVMEAMVFILKELPLERLAEKIVDQLLLPSDSDPGTRLSVLVKEMPSIQKLGQVICRTPGIDPVFKQALVDLEDNLKTVDCRQVLPLIDKQVRRLPPGHTLVPQRRILAEASVCAVVPAHVTIEKGAAPVQAVIKVVKPKVRRNMTGDLALLERLAVFLDKHKKRWGMREFNFSGTLHQVRTLIENEIDLASEQAHLVMAGEYHRNHKRLRIPDLLPVSTPEMTVMSRVEGRKITDVAQLNPRQRRLLAEALTRVCILSPLQDLGEISIFHGDPHAGNIAYCFEGGRPLLIFYDWAMMGRLSRLERFLMVFLSCGFWVESPKAVFFAADLITKGQVSRDKEIERKVFVLIDKILAGNKGGIRNVFGNIETFFEELTYMGILFSADLMMYEKAAVTLKGVLADIDPAFDRNDYLIWAGMAAFLNDVVRLRIHRVILEEIWALYRLGAGELHELQKEIGALFFRACFHWLRRPAEFMGR